LKYSNSFRHLHIISFNVPYPPDYGGVIDVFHKIRCLSEAGIKIHLHAFIYNRPGDPELEKYCESVNYYTRNTKINFHFSFLPYIVYSRKNNRLLQNLMTNNYPILFEGLHTCYYLGNPLLKDRIRIVRTHNIEHKYYLSLAKSDGNKIHRIYHFIESMKLRYFERVLKYADHIISISSLENAYFQNKYNKTHLVPPFHSFEKIQSLPGKGKYILLHGNLTVPENINAIKYLLPIIRNTTVFPIIIAGKDPGRDILELAGLYSDTRIIASPGIDEMYSLIMNSHLIILYTFQLTGTKLKLFDSVYLGRFIIANSTIIEGSGMKDLFEIADTPEILGQKISQTLKLTFTEEMLAKRKQRLSGFSNKHNAELIARLLK
jgi:hypothetical protein